MTQDILSGLSSDQVNSIGDTDESLQVATIIKQKYFDIINRVPMPDDQLLIQLDPSLSLDIPVLMYVPDTVNEIKWVKYFDNNTTGTGTSSGFIHSLNVDIASAGKAGTVIPGYKNVPVVSNLEFINNVTQFNPNGSNVVSYNFTEGDTKSYKLYFKNDRTPNSCTIIKNYYVLFDSYDSSVDDTLQASKTMVMGQVIPIFKMEDTFIPKLPEDQFQLLFNEAKTLAFFELKQQPHQLAMQEAKRGWSNVQKTKYITERPTPFDAIPNYGRWGRGSTGYPRFFKQLGFDR